MLSVRPSRMASDLFGVRFFRVCRGQRYVAGRGAALASQVAPRCWRGASSSVGNRLVVSGRLVVVAVPLLIQASEMMATPPLMAPWIAVAPDQTDWS